jgi:hypothetical protein
VATGVSQGSAGGNGKATSPLYSHRDSCTLDPADDPVGTATFTRNKGVVTLKVDFHSADPGTYYVYLYTGDCSYSWLLGKFKVSSGGDGSKTGSVDVSGYGHDFFAAPYNAATGYYAESDIVSL